MSISWVKSLRDRFEYRYLQECGYGSGQAFTEQLVASVGPGDVLLDVGCGEGNLREYLLESIFYVGLDRYIGVKGEEYAAWNMHPSIVGDAHHLPFKSNSCKAVALTHVLEHTHNPEQVLSEIARVLCSGGQTFVDVPFLHEIHHAPNDYFRYTRYGLNVLAEKAGLEVESILPSGGYFRAVAHLLREAPLVIKRQGILGWLVLLFVGYPLQGLGLTLEKLQYILDLHDNLQNFTCGYHCVFTKPNIE